MTQGFLFAVDDSSSCAYKILEDLSGFDNNEEKLLKLILPNGVRVLLCSDPDLMESSGAVSVETGSWDDPADHPGMAHFVEHLLFLGTKKYPVESEYMRYIHERGGECNAATYRDRSIYGFSIGKEADLEGVLDRFSQLFIDPLFSESAIAREIYAVHHEFEDTIEDEFFRIWRVFKETGNINHPNVNFSCGNLESLQNLTQLEIKDWFEKNYRPSGMYFVLLSPLPMDLLVKMTTSFFSLIPEREKEEQVIYKGSLSSPSQKECLIHLDATFNQRSLSLLWEIPASCVGFKQMFAFNLLKRVLTHGYVSSLVKILEREGLATEVGADFWRVEKEHGIFKITVNLTRKGVKNYEKVVKRCFEVLAFLKENPIPAYLISQEQENGGKCFLRGHQRAMEIAERLVDENLEVFPKVFSCNPLEVSFQVFKVLEELNPKSCLYFLVSPFKESGLTPSRLEKWMGTKYMIRQIAKENISYWSSVEPNPHFNFQPKESDAPFFPPEEMVSLPEPCFVIDDDMARIRLVESSERGENIEAFFCLTMKDLGKSLIQEALYKLFIGISEDALRKEFKEQELGWKISIEGQQLCILLFTTKEFFEERCLRFFSILRENQVSCSQFFKIKKELLASYSGDPDPLGFAKQVFDSYFNSHSYTQMEVYQQLSSIAWEDYREFEAVRFHEFFVEGAFLGQISADEVLSLCQAIYQKIPYSVYESPVKKIEKCDFSKEVILFRKTHRRGNALLSLISSGESVEEGGVSSQIINVVLQNAFFQELRTRQQMAYKLYSWGEVIDDQICYGFALQSSSYHPQYLIDRVNMFLDDFSSRNEEFFSPEQMDLIRNGLIIDLQNERKKSYKKDTIKRLEENIDKLEKITFQEVSDAMKRIFSKENRKRISVLIQGTKGVIS